MIKGLNNFLIVNAQNSPHLALSAVRICSFSLSYEILNRISLGFALLVRQKKAT